MMLMANMFLLESSLGVLDAPRKESPVSMAAFTAISGIDSKTSNGCFWLRKIEMINILISKQSWIRETVENAGDGDGILEQIGS